MRTLDNEFVRHIYRRIDKQKAQSNYQIEKVEDWTEINHFGNFISISNAIATNLKPIKYRYFLHVPDEYDINDHTLIAELFRVNNSNIHYGAKGHFRKGVQIKKNLLLFNVSMDGTYLVIDYFKDYYPVKKSELSKLIWAHDFLFK